MIWIISVNHISNTDRKVYVFMRKFIYLEDVEYKIYVCVCVFINNFDKTRNALNSWKYSQETIVNNKYMRGSKLRLHVLIYYL